MSPPFDYMKEQPKRAHYRPSWKTLPAVSQGFTRVADAPGGTRQVKCDACGKVIPSLGIGYHRGNHGARPCTERKP